MAMKKKSMCIDLDTEDSIYHLKVLAYTQTHAHQHMVSFWECTLAVFIVTFIGKDSGSVWAVGDSTTSSSNVPSERDHHGASWAAAAIWPHRQQTSIYPPYTVIIKSAFIPNVPLNGIRTCQAVRKVTIIMRDAEILPETDSLLLKLLKYVMVDSVFYTVLPLKTSIQFPSGI